MDRESLWTRRSNTNRQSSDSTKTESHGRPLGASKRLSSGDATSRSSLSNGIPPLNTTNNAPPGASSAFGLGSGAFASFGSATKAPKTTGNTFDFKNTSVSSPIPETEKPTKVSAKPSSGASHGPNSSKSDRGTARSKDQWPLKSAWVMWYRPPTSKNSDYEKSIKPVYKISTAQHFWKVFSHLKRPSTLPTVSDYHFFKDGIRPVWEDEENKKGGKWIMRLKKGVIDRYWEALLLTVVGDQFVEAGEELCGMVISVRGGEDVLSVWTKYDSGRNVKIRETIKHVLSLPSDTILIWKSHDDSIAQRSAIEHARQEKGGEHRRRSTMQENSQ